MASNPASERGGVSASRRIIGLALLDPPTALESARAAGLTAEWLEGELDREAWRCIVAMEAEGKPIDEHFVAEYAAMNRMRLSLDYLRECLAVAPSRRNGADSLVDSLRREYVARENKRLAEILAMDTGDPVATASEVANCLLDVAGKHGITDTPESISAEIDADWDKALAGEISGLPMPWSRTYHRSGSVDPGQVCIIVGHGGGGKSSLVLQWALHLAERNIPCAVFPFEDGWKIALKRLAGMRAKVNIFPFRIGLALADRVCKAKRGKAEVMAMPLHISPVRGAIEDIAVECQRLYAKHGIKAVFVDAFKDIAQTRDGVYGDNEVMAGLVNIAKRLNVAVVCCHHVRKASSNAKDKRFDAWRIDPSDLRGSGRLWDDARVVYALQQRPSGEDQYGNITFDFSLHVLKANHGLAGQSVPLRRTEWLAWEEVDDENNL